uniref:Putative heat shock protein 70 family n=1 Tax=Helianthus annuus TaxID=4232 RepID=A0A251TKJ5_HELAN
MTLTHIQHHHIRLLFGLWICFNSAAHGFFSGSKMSQKVKVAAIGIDLGTTYSCAAVWFDRKKRVEVIPNEQGNNITPSCVAFNDTDLLVGEGAKNQIARSSTNTVFGKSFLLLVLQTFILIEKRCKTNPRSG